MAGPTINFIKNLIAYFQNFENNFDDTSQAKQSNQSKRQQQLKTHKKPSHTQPRSRNIQQRHKLSRKNLKPKNSKRKNFDSNIQCHMVNDPQTHYYKAKQGTHYYQLRGLLNAPIAGEQMNQALNDNCDVTPIDKKRVPEHVEFENLILKNTKDFYFGAHSCKIMQTLKTNQTPPLSDIDRCTINVTQNYINQAQYTNEYTNFIVGMTLLSVCLLGGAITSGYFLLHQVCSYFQNENNLDNEIDEESETSAAANEHIETSREKDHAQDEQLTKDNDESHESQRLLHISHKPYGA